LTDSKSVLQSLSSLNAVGKKPGEFDMKS